MTGIHLDEARNNRHATEINSDGSLPVLVVPTDEEWEIACERRGRSKKEASGRKQEVGFVC